MRKDLIRYSISITVSKEELECTKRQVKALKRKYGIPRSHVLKMILVDYLADDEIIEVLKTKGDLRTKKLECRKPKKFG